MLFGLIGFAFLCLYIYLDDTTVNDDFTFSGTEINIDVSACRIKFKKGTQSDVNIHVNSQTRASYFNSTQPDNLYFETTATSLKMLNPNQDVDACDIEIESAKFPDIKINCEKLHCPVTHDDDDLNFSGKLEITHGDEADGNVYFKNIDVSEINMNITGTL